MDSVKSKKRIGDFIFSVIISILCLDVIYLIYSYEGIGTDLLLLGGGCLFCFLCLLGIKFLNRRFLLVDVLCYVVGIGLTFVVNDIYYGDYFTARISPYTSMKLWPFPFYILHYTVFISALLLLAICGLMFICLEEIKKPTTES